MSRIAQPYCDARETITHVPASSYKSENWNMNFDHFPDRDKIIDFMTYRVILSNYRTIKDDIYNAVAAKLYA
jgi:hypothetical protein